MSAKVKEALFELISSMTKSEKRYFKLMASRHTIGDENNYVVLFDFIEKQDSYNEDDIFKAFKGEPFLNRFSITKKRLYDHILQSLDAFYTNSSAEAQLFKQLHSAEILYEKSLYDQAKRILKSAEKQAIKQENFIMLQKINRLMKKLIENEGYTENSVEQIDDLFQKDTFYNQQSRLYDKLWKIKSDLFTLLRTKGVARTLEEREVFTQILDQMPEERYLEGFENKYLFNHIQSAYHFSCQELELSMASINKNLQLFQENEVQLKEQLGTFISLLTNAIYIEESLGNKAIANNLLSLLRKLPQDHSTAINEDMEIKLFSSLNSVELGVLIKRGDLELASKLTTSIEEGLEKYASKLTPSRKAFLAFKLSTVHLGLGQHSEALRWINKILNDPDLDPSEDLLAFTYLIDLLIHLEMKHDQLLPYSLKNTQRFLKSRNKMHGFEKVFLNFISKLIKCKDRFDAELLWADLLQDLNDLNGEGLEKVAMEYFDFKAWAESKVKRKDFSSLLKERTEREIKKAS